MPPTVHDMALLINAAQEKIKYIKDIEGFALYIRQKIIRGINLMNLGRDSYKYTLILFSAKEFLLYNNYSLLIHKSI